METLKREMPGCAELEQVQLQVDTRPSPKPISKQLKDLKAKLAHKMQVEEGVAKSLEEAKEAAEAAQRKVESLQKDLDERRAAIQKLQEDQKALVQKETQEQGALAMARIEASKEAWANHIVGTLPEGIRKVRQIAGICLHFAAAPHQAQAELEAKDKEDAAKKAKEEADARMEDGGRPECAGPEEVPQAMQLDKDNIRRKLEEMQANGSIDIDAAADAIVGMAGPAPKKQKGG